MLITKKQIEYYLVLKFNKCTIYSYLKDFTGLIIAALKVR